jgi:hypothetical protein
VNRPKTLPHLRHSYALDTGLRPTSSNESKPYLQASKINGLSISFFLAPRKPETRRMLIALEAFPRQSQARTLASNRRDQDVAARASRRRRSSLVEHNWIPSKKLGARPTFREKCRRATGPGADLHNVLYCR